MMDTGEVCAMTLLVLQLLLWHVDNWDMLLRVSKVYHDSNSCFLTSNL